LLESYLTGGGDWAIETG